MEWTNETRTLGQLKPWQHNPRHIQEDKAELLKDSFDTFGQIETVAIGPSNGVYNGHQRLAVLLKDFGPDYEIAVRVGSRELTEQEKKQLTAYLHSGATGDWNIDEVANLFSFDELVDWGMPKWMSGFVDENQEDESYDEMWEGMPEYESEEGFKLKMTVHFKTIEDKMDFASLIGQSMTEKTNSIWHPYQENANLKGRVYTDES